MFKQQVHHCNTIQYQTIAIPYNTKPLQYHTILNHCNTIQYQTIAIPYNAMLHRLIFNQLLRDLGPSCVQTPSSPQFSNTTSVSATAAFEMKENFIFPHFLDLYCRPTFIVCGGKYFFVEVIIEEVALCEPFLLRIVCQPPNLYVTYNQYGNKRKIQKSKKKSKLCVSCLTFISPPTNMARGVE